MPFTATLAAAAIAPTLATAATATVATGAVAAGGAAAATAGGIGLSGALGLAALGVGAAGIGLTAYGQIQAGKQAEANAEYNAQVQQNQAIREEQAAKHDADLLSERGRKLRASQRAQTAAAGVTAAGSPFLLFEQTARDLAQDIELTRFGGTQRSSFLKSKSRLTSLQGSQAKRAAGIGAFGTLLSGAGSTALQARSLI
jgi:uncharacterized protein HemX